MPSPLPAEVAGRDAAAAGTGNGVFLGTKEVGGVSGRNAGGRRPAGRVGEGWVFLGFLGFSWIFLGFFCFFFGLLS